MVFPKNATNEERTINWRKIAEISDADFGFDTPREKTDKVRFCVRILLENSKGEFCVVKSRKYGYFQLPGGGIEGGESITEALKREAEEETGWSIKDIEPIGYVLERREDVRNTHDFDRCISYVFRATPDRRTGEKYTASELAEDLAPEWMSLDEIIAAKEGTKGDIESYSGCFSDERDLSIVKFYQTKMKGVNIL